MNIDSWCNTCWRQDDRKECEGCVVVKGLPSKFISRDCSYRKTCVYYKTEGNCLECLGAHPKSPKNPVEVKVKGVSKDAPKTTNEQGGSQSAVAYGFDCLDPKAMFAMCEALEEGRQSYGKDNWRKIPMEDHINHLLIHIFAYLAGDTQDDHLGHAMCRAMFAKAVDLETNKNERG